MQWRWISRTVPHANSPVGHHMHCKPRAGEPDLGIDICATEQLAHAACSEVALNQPRSAAAHAVFPPCGQECRPGPFHACGALLLLYHLPLHCLQALLQGSYLLYISDDPLTAQVLKYNEQHQYGTRASSKYSAERLTSPRLSGTSAWADRSAQACEHNFGLRTSDSPWP